MLLCGQHTGLITLLTINGKELSHRVLTDFKTKVGTVFKLDKCMNGQYMICGIQGIQRFDIQVVGSDVKVYPDPAVSFPRSNVAKAVEVKPNIFLVALFYEPELYVLDITDNSIITVERKKHLKLKSVCNEFFLMDFTDNFVLYRNDRHLFLVDFRKINSFTKSVTMHLIYESPGITYNTKMEEKITNMVCYESMILIDPFETDQISKKCRPKQDFMVLAHENYQNTTQSCVRKLFIDLEGIIG